MTTLLDLAGWDSFQPAPTRAGSLYSVPAPDRLSAAHQLAAVGWWLHVDVILRSTPTGVDQDAGVPLDLLAEVRAQNPEADLEVHVIDLVTDGAVEGDVTAALGAVMLARPDRVVLSSALLTCPGVVSAVRAAGAQLWVEIATEVDVTAAALTGAHLALDGALIMLIDPGTTQACDLTRLEAIAALPPGLRIGVDGGIGREHTAALLHAGVGHIVSGRALLASHAPLAI